MVTGAFSVQLGETVPGPSALPLPVTTLLCLCLSLSSISLAESHKNEPFCARVLWLSIMSEVTPGWSSTWSLFILWHVDFLL